MVWKSRSLRSQSLICDETGSSSLKHALSWSSQYVSSLLWKKLAGVLSLLKWQQLQYMLRRKGLLLLLPLPTVLWIEFSLFQAFGMWFMKSNDCTQAAHSKCLYNLCLCSFLISWAMHLSVYPIHRNNNRIFVFMLVLSSCFHFVS